MTMVGGARAGVGGVRLADGSGNNGVGDGGFPVVDSVNVSGVKLTSVDVSNLSPTIEWVVWVNTVGRPYRLDRSALAATLTVDNIAVASVLGEPNSRWVALQWQNLDFWQTADWYIDPANSTGVANDENPGTLLLPLKSTAEYRRRIHRVNYTTALIPGAQVTIHFLSGSTVTDDGNFTGITGTGIIFNIIGIPTPIGAGGTFDAATVPFAGNGRYTVTDTSENWTTNGWVSTATNPRLIRNTAKTKHAWVLTYVGGGVASLSQPTDASETAGFSNSNVNFNNGEAYEVCSIPTLPTLQTTFNSGITVVVRCMKITTGPMAPGGTLFQVLGAIVPATAMAWTEQATTPAFFNSFFGGVQSFFNIPIFRTAVAFGASLQFYKSIDNTTNSLILQASSVIANGCGGSIGLLKAFDVTGPVITGRFGATAVLIEGMVGTGNTSKLIDSTGGSVFTGGANVTAATTDANPFRLNGVSGAALPVIDAVAGGAIYS